jgi:hypothetical protein
MKKLLSLVLVLALTSLASATFSLTLVGSTISMSSDVAVAPAGGLEMYWALLGTAGMTISDSGAVAAQSGTGFDMQINGDVSGAGLTGNGTWGTLFTTGGSIAAGDLFTGFTFTGTGTVTLVKILEDFSGFDGDQASLIIPEPATIALLCLGGLLLRKK